MTETADRQPDELGELKKLAVEFIEKFQSIENEISLLNEDKKMLVEEYSDRLDMPTLKAALQVLKISNKVKHKDTFDAFLEVLRDPA